MSLMGLSTELSGPFAPMSPPAVALRLALVLDLLAVDLRHSGCPPSSARTTPPRSRRPTPLAPAPALSAQLVSPAPLAAAALRTT